MELLTSLHQLKKIKEPSSLTIGNFDGVHLGHQALLKRASIAISFRNHPSSILKKETVTPFICTPEHKIRLLEEMGLSTLCLLDFTHEIAAVSAEHFIDLIRSYLPFTTLLMGEGAVIGKNREGTAPVMQAIASKKGFQLFYLPHELYEGSAISSSRIRQAIAKGELNVLQQLLGREYSIESRVIRGAGRGRSLGFPTLNFSVEGLCHLPFGVYSILLKRQNEAYRGVANLGIAPTLNQSRAPLLEVHLPGVDLQWLNETAEVIFKKFIRQEMRFENRDALSAQIKKDLDSMDCP